MPSRKKKQPILIENIKIIDTANKGRSFAKYNDISIFITGGVPGDVCDIIVFKKKKKFWQARIEKIHNYSKKRTDPKCEHFGVCGGCKWQNMNYASQLDFKQNEVLNNLKRIGGIKVNEHLNIIVSPGNTLFLNLTLSIFAKKVK